MFLCLQSTPPRPLPSLNPLGRTAPICEGKIGIPVLRQRQHSDLAIDASKSHHPPQLFKASYRAPSPLWPLSYPLHAWVRVDSETPRQQRGFKSGGQACICVSKVRLRCRMLSFSGWWLQSEQDDNTDPHGWRVKRAGKTWINRGPGTQCDLNSHWIPWGDKRPQLRGGNHALQLKLLLLCLQTCWPALLWCFWWTVLHFPGHQLVSTDWWHQHGAIETRDVYQQQLSDGHDLSLELSFSLKIGSDRFSQHREKYSFS